MAGAKSVKSKIENRKSKTLDEVEMVQKSVVVAREVDGDFEDKLDPAEEKMLDRILMGIVIFILAWLGLSVFLVVLGYFGVWK